MWAQELSTPQTVLSLRLARPHYARHRPEGLNDNLVRLKRLVSPPLDLALKEAQYPPVEESYRPGCLRAACAHKAVRQSQCEANTRVLPARLKSKVW